MNPDRRQSPREAPDHAALVSTRVILLSPDDQGGDEEIEAAVVDFSSNGLRLRVGRPLAQDSALRVDLAGRLLLGEVRYCQTTATPGLYVAGIRVRQSLTITAQLRRLLEELRTPNGSAVSADR